MNGESSTPVDSPAAQGSVYLDGRVNVPTWALWLIGAGYAVFLAAVAGLAYANSTLHRTIANLRGNPSEATSTAIKLEEVQDPRTQAPSQTTVKNVSNTNGASTATLKASNPRSQMSTELRSRSASQEGVICLD